MLNEHEYHATRVEDIRADGLVLAMPMRKSVPVFLPEGELFEGKVIKDGVLYAFQAHLLSRALTPLPVWRISEPESIRKIQLRSFVRLDIGLKTMLWSLDDENKPLDGTRQAAVTKNISAGGALIVSAAGYPIGAKVFVKIICDANTDIQSFASIVRCMPEFREPGSPPLYLLGIQYVDLEERERRKFIQFINAKQIERRQRGML